METLGLTVPATTAALKEPWRGQVPTTESASRIATLEREVERLKGWIRRIRLVAVFDGGQVGSPSPLGEEHDTFDRVERMAQENVELRAVARQWKGALDALVAAIVRGVEDTRAALNDAKKAGIVTK